MGELRGGQLGGRPWRRMATERLHAAFTGAPHPLADRPFGDAQGRRDVLLLPALLFQFPRSSSSAFEPIEVCGVRVHTSLVLQVEGLTRRSVDALALTTTARFMTICGADTHELQAREEAPRSFPVL